jgi:hypothetical protein
LRLETQKLLWNHFKSNDVTFRAHGNLTTEKKDVLRRGVINIKAMVLHCTSPNVDATKPATEQHDGAL